MSWELYFLAKLKLGFSRSSPDFKKWATKIALKFKSIKINNRMPGA